MLYVSEQILQPTCAAGVAAFFTNLIRAAKVEPETPFYILRRQTCLPVLLGLMFQVKAQLVIELSFDGAAVEQRTEPVKQVASHAVILNPAHAPRPQPACAKRWSR